MTAKKASAAETIATRELPTWTPSAKGEERASTLTAARDVNGKRITLHEARKLGKDNKPIATIRSIDPIPADWYERILKRRAT